MPVATTERRVWDRRISKNLDMASGSHSERTIESKLSDIDNMIRRENDEEKRNVLLVLHCLTSTLSSVTRVLEDLEKHHNDRFCAAEKRLEEHEDYVIQGKAAWKVAIIFGAVIQALLAGIAAYGYTQFVDLHEQVVGNDRQITKLEEKVSSHNQLNEPITRRPQNDPH